jgi:hypothetical protein
MNAYDDLYNLNMQLLQHEYGLQNGLTSGLLPMALERLTVCVATLAPPFDELSAAIANLDDLSVENPSDITYANKIFLDYARGLSRSIMDGRFDGILVLGIDYQQASCLCRMSSTQIYDLSRLWQGRIYRIRKTATLEGIHPMAIRLYHVPFMTSSLRS